MKQKRHKKEEINFCQSGLHRQPFIFCEGDTCYLVETQTMEKYCVKVIVCPDCKKIMKERAIEKILLEG